MTCVGLASRIATREDGSLSGLLASRRPRGPNSLNFSDGAESRRRREKADAAHYDLVDVVELVPVVLVRLRCTDAVATRPRLPHATRRLSHSHVDGVTVA